MDYQQILNELYRLESSKIKLGLENIKILLDKIGNPQQKLKCIHVAGTNGKGSVCAMINSVLINSGYKVGMYTSPHLKRFNERIRINNELITNKDIVWYYAKIKKYITNQSFFEITTAMAFLYFYEQKVDFVVLEVGLGGRLDATNVVVPLVSIITNIDYEHTLILGKSLSKIAYEKAGIIKENIPAVTAAEGTALKTIMKIAKMRNSELSIIKRKKIKKFYDEKNGIWSFCIKNYRNLKLTNLKGEFQVINAAIAVTAIDAIKKYYNISITEKNVKYGLLNAKWAGRFQYTAKNVLIDCAHNPNGFKALANELDKVSYDKLIVVAGFSNDKDIKKISEIIKPKAEQIILTKSKSHKAADTSLIKKYFNNPIIIKNPKNALNYAKKTASKKDLVLVTGSIYMIGEVV
ncbi:bifunctional folylpolyglutamate synthase/dihydrofolate synthase [Candidatus Woesearchaeota archaeon]|nr:bifunctional folylpolyglutamate synthase/dihydrofolate synthase [Candidatus Woesearchaeota archaeon]